MQLPRPVEQKNGKATGRHIKSAIPSLALVLAAAALFWPLSVWLVRSDTGNQAQRWQSTPTVTENDYFSRLSNPPDHKPDSQLLPQHQIAGKPITDWTKPNVTVYAAPVRHQSRALLRDLSGDAQARAVDLLAKNLSSPSWSELRKALIDDAHSGIDDPFHFNRTLVATVTKGTQWEPGDRMIWTRVFVQPINFKFAGYTVAATDNETAKITSIEATTSQKISAQIGATVPGLTAPAASVDPSEEHAVKTKSDIAAQYERLGIDILPGFLRIIRESGTGGDVVGNTRISLAIETDPWTVQKRYPTEEIPAINDDVVLVVTGMHINDGADDLTGKAASLTVIPQTQLPHCRLLARIWMLYEQRRITKGREFYDESRQTVELYRDATQPADVEIMGADDVAPFWVIRIVPPGQTASEQKSEKTKVLGTMLPPDGQFRELAFTDYLEASQLAGWVRRNRGAQIGTRILNYPAGASLVPFRKTEDECDGKGKSTVLDAAGAAH
jgi:hypothetical protein